MQNIKYYPLWESPLFEEEIEVLISVLRDTLAGFHGNGAYVLTSQKNTSVCEERVLEFEIGAKKSAIKDEKAELDKAIKNALKSDKGENCIKWVKNQPILIINAAYGRFIVGFFAGDPDFSVGVLAATAKTLTRLSSEDGALKGSCKEIPWHEFADELPIVVRRVTELFDIHKTAAIKRWEEWRKFSPTKELFFAM